MLFNSGRPLIVVHAGAEALEARRVLIAWDGSGRAARAVNDALSFLRAADHVEIVRVTGEKDLSRSPAAAEMLPQLTRHGVEAVVREIAAPRGDAAEALRRQAVESGAELIVTGAFVHSRLHQLVFGGVTGSLLHDSPAPLFLSY